MTDIDTDLRALEAFVIDNPDLEKLENLLDQFNLFEAIGMVHQELRHSDFLAFLLNPAQNHGLDDVFAKRLLQKALVSAGNPQLPISPIDLDIWSLDELEVRREWQNIDILLLDELHQLAVIIENKVTSREHSEQLQRYRQSIEHQYPGWRIISLFLTPQGNLPTDASYLSISYDLICQLVEQLLAARASTLGPDVVVLMTHYAQMLRRHIVPDSELADPCRRIYRKHQRALDLIYEHRPDLQANLHDELLNLVTNTPGLILDYESKSYILFWIDEWSVPSLLTGEGWRPDGRIMLFQFENLPDRLQLKLLVGPGPLEIRHRLYEMANTHSPFTAFRTLGKKWNTIFKRSFLTAKSYEEASLSDLQEEISRQWQRFLEKDLPAIKTVVREQEWIWVKQSE